MGIRFCQLDVLDASRWKALFLQLGLVEHSPADKASQLVLPQGLAQADPGTSSKHGYGDPVFFYNSLQCSVTSL